VLFEDAAAGATTALIDVVLTSQPYADVLIEIANASPRDAAISPRVLTFTPSDWDTPKSVTLTSKDDLVDDGDVNVMLVLSAAESTDAVYNSVDPADVSWTSIDNDTFGVTVTSGSGTDGAGNGCG